MPGALARVNVDERLFAAVAPHRLGTVRAAAALPDRDSPQADVCGPTCSYDSHTRLVLESKAKMRPRDALRRANGTRSRSPLRSRVAPRGFARKLEYPAMGMCGGGRLRDLPLRRSNANRYALIGYRAFAVSLGSSGRMSS